MEMRKWSYLNSFLQRPQNKSKLNHFLSWIRDSAEEIHDCYEEAYCRTWDLRNDTIKQTTRTSKTSYDGMFTVMVLVDASFIIELFLRAYRKGGTEESQFAFEGPGKMHDIRRDLFLVQNQLPFFLLKGLYELAFDGNPRFPSFLTLTCHFFRLYYNQNTSIENIESLSNIKAMLENSIHFTDLLRTLQIPFPKEHCRNEKPRYFKPQLVKGIKDRVISLYEKSVDLQSSLLPSCKKQEENEVRGEYLYSAILLREAGVKFKVSRRRCLLEIEFHHGELKIPCLRVEESTESFFRNLMAWEQRHHPQEAHICDYIFLMGFLIKSTKDVDLLIRKRIMVNRLGSNTAVVELFNKFSNHVTQRENSRYANIFGELGSYCAVRHHGWMANLRLQHFSTPWKGMATIAAIVLLVLTFIQTICTVVPRISY